MENVPEPITRENGVKIITSPQGAKVSVEDGREAIDAHKVAETTKRMMEKGVYVVALSNPVFPKGKAGIRTQLTAALREEDITYIVDCFKQIKKDIGL